MSLPFTGLTGRTLRSGYLHLTESKYPPRLSHPLHGHDPAYFTVVLEGCYAERTGAATRVVESGALLFHPASEEHAVQFGANATRIFRLEPLPAMLEEFRLSHVRWDVSLARDANPVRQLVLRMRQAYIENDALAPLAVDGLACELVAIVAGTLTRRRSSQRANALRARDAIEAQLDQSVTLAGLAQEIHCHPMTLVRAFRRTFGCSVGTYLRRRRLEEASRLLRSSDTPISVIALRTGFSDQAHLTRTLGQATGFTPAAWRARYKLRP
jgi:AraC family transcriptional regulator